jgi:hypothetical protein
VRAGIGGLLRVLAPPKRGTRSKELGETRSCWGGIYAVIWRI